MYNSKTHARTALALRSHACHWRRVGIPGALQQIGTRNGIDWGKSIILDLEIDYPGMPELFGALLSQDERFIRFEIDVAPDIQVYRWEDVTAAQNCKVRNKGIGMGQGALAIKVLRELNAE